MVDRSFPKHEDFACPYALAPAPVEVPLAEAAVRDLAVVGAAGGWVGFRLDDGTRFVSALRSAEDWPAGLFAVGGQVRSQGFGEALHPCFLLRWSVEPFPALGLVRLGLELGLSASAEYSRPLHRLLRDNSLVDRLIREGARSWPEASRSASRSR